MAQSFAQKQIKVSIQLSPNAQTNQPRQFVQGGMPVGDSVTLPFLRTSVRVQNAGSPASGTAQVKVWGIEPSLMNQLATLGLVFNLVPKNTLTIQAGDVGGQLATVFTGTVWAAYGDYGAQPKVPFVLECLTAAFDAAASAPPTSFPQPFSVASAMSGFARQMNVGFVNSGGVSVMLPPTYFAGSVKTQAQKCADAANIYWGFPNAGTMEIWPKGGSRNNPSVPTIGPATGMISYPAFTQQGIIVKTLFNPLIAFGGLVKVESSVLSAIAAAQPTQQGLAGPSTTFPTQWAVNKLDLALDAQVPKGEWASVVYGYNPGYAKTILPPS